MRGSCILSLDVGSTRVSGILFYLDGSGSPRVRYLASRPVSGVENGKIINPYALSSEILSFFQVVEREAGTKVLNAIVGVNAIHCEGIALTGVFQRRNPASPLSKWEVADYITHLRKTCDIDGKEIIHILPDRFVVDGNAFNGMAIGVSGSRVEIAAKGVAVPTKLLRDLKGVMERMNVNVVGVYCNIVSAAHSVLLKDDFKSEVLLLDIGGDTTEFALIREGIFVDIGGVEGGGNIITSDIKEVTGIPWHYAEKIKRSSGSAYSRNIPEREMVALVFPSMLPREISRKKLCEIIEARVREIFEIVFSVIESRTGYAFISPGKKRVKRIVLTGGGALLRHISCVVEEMTGIETFLGFPVSSIPPLDDDEFVRRISSPEFAVPLGQMWIYSTGMYDPDPSPSSLLEKMLSIINAAILEN